MIIKIKLKIKKEGKDSFGLQTAVTDVFI